MIRNSPKTLTWLIKLAFFTLFPASVKTVYRVQNCIPKMVIHRLLWASNSKSTFITKFEYWKEFSDSITSRVHTAGLMGKDYLILMTIEYKSCWHALLRTYHCSLVKRFFFFSAHHYKDNFRAWISSIGQKLFISRKFWKNKESNYYVRHKNLVQNSLCSNFIVWLP